MRYALIHFALFGGVLMSAGAAAAQDPHLHQPSGAKASTMQTPPSLAAEHRELHEMLARASKEGGELGRAAEDLEEVLAPHFKREEEIATPPLGLLPKLARERATADMRALSRGRDRWSVCEACGARKMTSHRELWQFLFVKCAERLANG